MVFECGILSIPLSNGWPMAAVIVLFSSRVNYGRSPFRPKITVTQILLLNNSRFAQISLDQFKIKLEMIKIWSVTIFIAPGLNRVLMFYVPILNPLLSLYRFPFRVPWWLSRGLFRRFITGRFFTRTGCY